MSKLSLSAKQDARVLSHRTEVSVRFSEVDAIGIVWHGHYVKYMEDGREAFGAHFGISYLDVQRAGFTVPLVKVNCEFKKPLKYGDRAIIETNFHLTPAAKIIFTYQIFNAANMELMAVGESVQVFVDAAGSLCIVNPDFYESWKHKFIPSLKGE